MNNEEAAKREHIQTLLEAREQSAASCNNNVRQKQRPKIGSDGLQGLKDSLCNAGLADTCRTTS
jgi:hypothetical protein